MADKTLTVNGQPFTINRDRKAEVTQLTVNGQAFHIDRTAPVIESDPVGNSRPLLDKLVGGAACAYSLRDLNSKQGDTNVVNIRRSEDNEEKVFQAKDVPKIEDWVGGKQETTLPADVATAAAAYSLRKVNSSYSGNAVRIRRTTDSTEVDVAFDLDDKVSSSSAVTNVAEQGGESESTTATTLGDFLSETTNVAKSYDHSQDPTSPQIVYVTAGRFGTSNPVLYDGNTNSDSLPTIPGGARYATKWTANNPLYGFKVGNSYNGETFDIEFDILQKAGTENVQFGNTNFMELYPHANIIEGSLGAGQTFTTKDSWVHFKMKLRTGEGNTGGFLIRSSNTSVQTTWYLANLTMTPTVDSSAHVHTWYDQTKDLTQLSTYFNATLSSSNFAVNAMTEEFGTFFGRDNAVKLTSTAGNTQRFDSIDFGIGAGESVRFTAQIYVPSTNTALDSFAYSEKFDVSGYDRKQGVITPAQDQWVDIDFNYVQIDDTVQRIIFWNSASTTPTANNNSDGDVIYFRNMVVTRVTKAQANATQDTSSNQPKIAENGALLTEDGKAKISYANNSTLTFNSSIATGTTFSLFAKFKPIGDNCRLIQNPSGAPRIDFEQGTPDVVEVVSNSFGNDKMDLKTSFLNNTHIFTLINNSTSVSAFSEAVGSSENPNTVTGNFTFTTLGGTSTQEHQEIIIYTSDQSSNRFKIESNINNYYGLYNDHKDLAASAFSATYGTISNNSKDGFDWTTSQTQSFVGIRLSKKIPVGEKVYISFNCTHDGYSESTLLSLRKSGFTGSNASGAATLRQNGFNSITLTSNDADAEYITFQIRQDSPTVTVRDFKVSYITREGFVETWYDQSGHNRHAIQSLEPAQPSLVINGGFIKVTGKNFYGIDTKGRISGAGLGQKAGLSVENYNPTQTDGALTEYSVFAVYDTQTADSPGNIGSIFTSGGASNNTGYGGLMFGNTHGTRLVISNTDGISTGGGSYGFEDSICAATSSNLNAYNSTFGTNIVGGYFTHGVGLVGSMNDHLSADVETDAPVPHASNSSTQGRVMLLAERTFQQRNPFKGRVSEIIFYEKDHRLNREAIVTNINNQYQIY